MKKYICLHGAINVDNFGDTLFALYFYNWLIETNTIDDENIIIPYAHNRVRKLLNISKLKGIRGILKSDKIVFIGGGYLGERPNRKLSWNLRLVYKHLSIGLIAKFLNKPYIFIGVGAGPLSYGFTRKLVTYLCNNSEKVIVRDVESKDYLLEYGVNRNKIKTTVDSILLLQKKDVNKEWDQKYKKVFDIDQNVNKTHIGVHLQASSSKDEKIKTIISDLKKYCEGLTEFQIVVFNDTYKKSPNDNLLNMLYQEFEKNKVTNVEYKHPEQLIALINNLDILITTKLHSGIVANCLGKYTLSISVHNKTERLYKQLNIIERNVSIDDYKKGQLNNMLKDYDPEKKFYTTVTPEIRRKAIENKKSLIEFVNN